MQVWSVYIIRCGDDSLYTGITTELPRRLREHGGTGTAGAKYLRGRGPRSCIPAAPPPATVKRCASSDA